MTRLEYLKEINSDLSMTSQQQRAMGWNFFTVHSFLNVIAGSKIGESSSDRFKHLASNEIRFIDSSNIIKTREYLDTLCTWKTAILSSEDPVDEKYTKILVRLDIPQNISITRAESLLQEVAVQHMLGHYHMLLEQGSFPQPCSTCTALDAFYEPEA